MKIELEYKDSSNKVHSVKLDTTNINHVIEIIDTADIVQKVVFNESQILTLNDMKEFSLLISKINSKYRPHRVSIQDVYGDLYNRVKVLHKDSWEVGLNLASVLSNVPQNIKSSPEQTPFITKSKLIYDTINNMISDNVSYKIQTLPCDFTEVDYKLTVNFKSDDDTLKSMFDKLNQVINLDVLVRVFHRKPNAKFFIKLSKSEGVTGYDYIGEYENFGKSDNNDEDFEFLYLKYHHTCNIYNQIEIAIEKLFIIHQYVLNNEVNPNFSIKLDFLPIV